MIKRQMWLIFVMLLTLVLVACQAATQENPAIHFRLTLGLDDVSNLQDAIIDRLADLALGSGDSALATGLATVAHDLRSYITDIGTPPHSDVTIILDSEGQGGTLDIHYLNGQQQRQGSTHTLSSEETQKLYQFLSSWSSSRK